MKSKKTVVSKKVHNQILAAKKSVAAKMKKGSNATQKTSTAKRPKQTASATKTSTKNTVPTAAERRKHNAAIRAAAQLARDAKLAPKKKVVATKKPKASKPIEAAALATKPSAEKQAGRPVRTKLEALPARDVQNGVREPKQGSIEMSVWSICENFKRIHERPPLREDAVPVAIAEGVKAHTARLYVGNWRRFNGLTPGGVE
jgi:hypothetical protein